MSRILLDGESVYEASVAIGELKNNSMNIAKYDALMNVIYGIVLWDEVYVILDKYGNLEDIVKYAFELKYDPKVVKFRKEIDNLEEAFLRGSLLEIKSYFENIKETIEDISKTKGIDRSIDITLSFPPALSTSIDLPKARPNQCLFIKDLAYYGINERIPKPLPNGKLYT